MDESPEIKRKVATGRVYELTLKSKKTSGSYEKKLEILEEAHLISQPYGIPHFVVHWEMFKLALMYRQGKEVLGQIPRLVLAMPGSWLDRAPKGNVGSTKMGIFEEKQ